MEESPQPVAPAARHWLAALPPLLLLRLAPATALSGATRGSIALAALTLGGWLYLDWQRAGADVEFDAYNLAVYGLLALLALGVAATARALCRPRPAFGAVLFLVAAALPVLAIAAVAIPAWNAADLQLPAIVALSTWIAAYLVRGLRALCGTPQPRAFAACALLLGAAVLAQREVGWSTALWYEAEAETAAADSVEDSADELIWNRGEDLLFTQRARIDAALRALGPRGEVPAAGWFVGFAGVAEEKVFAEEIRLAARVVGAKYGTSARSLLLLNDRRDLDSAPLATLTGLAYVLDRLGARMDREHDTLFLALSSHGSGDPLLSVSVGELPLLQVDGKSLRAALDAAGIKWRVILISACYAGAFIEPLKNPETVVIAAAAPDRTSFGCSNERDLTWFGEAFYRDALPLAGSLEEAFTRAKAAIAARERVEDVEPSEPQAWFGEEIVRRLEPAHTPS